MATPKSQAKKQMSEKRLRNIAIWYCERYLVSCNKLTDHLRKRLRRDVIDEQERDKFSELIPGIVSNLVELGYVSDKEAASARLRSALRAGYATQTAITVASRAALVDRETVETELDNALAQALPEINVVDDDIQQIGNEQVLLALKRARRGPFRGTGQDKKSRRRDISWLQRRGYRVDEIYAALEIDLAAD